MISPIVCLVSRYALRDAESNTISVINILEGIQAEGFPVFFGPAAFVVIWSRDASDPPEFQGEFTLDLDGDRIHASTIAISFGTGTRNRTVINIQGVILQKPGSMVFEAHIDGEMKARYEVLVQSTEAAK